MASYWVAMKRLQLLIIFVVVGTILSGCVSPRPSQSAVSAEEAKEIAEEITRICEPRGTTVLTKDTAYLKSLWADDFSYIGADGTVRDDIAQKIGSKFAVENLDPWPKASCQLDVRRHLCPPKCRSKRRDCTITSAYPIKT